MRNEISRKIIIDKYQGNTHYTVHVIDSFGQEHHIDIDISNGREPSLD